MNSLKELNESRDSKVAEMETMLSTAKTESRAMNEEEIAKFDNLEKEIKNIDSSIEAEQRASALKIEEGKKMEEVKVVENRAEAEERAFEAFVRDKLTEEQRAGEINWSKSNNGAIVPASIAKRIIEEIHNVCPIAANATRYNIGGKLTIPVYGKDNGHDITVGFYNEFDEVVADAGKFTGIVLNDYITMALTLVSKELINNQSFDVISFIVKEVAKKYARFIEQQLLVGNTDSSVTPAVQRTEGACSTTNTLTAASATAIAVDDLIKLQAKVKVPYQKNAVWTMSRDTFTAIETLKDGMQRPLLMPDYSTHFPFVLLGKPVYISDNMAQIATGAKTVLYGDYSAMALKFSQNVEIQVLREKYATKHAVGVLASCEVDCKVQDHQGLAVLVQA